MSWKAGVVGFPSCSLRWLTLTGLRHHLEVPWKAAVPTCLCKVISNETLVSLLPHFCFMRDRDEQNQTGTILCVTCRSGRKGWSSTLTENPERCIKHSILSLFSQLALILSFARAETTWIFYILHCFQEICSLVLWVSKSTSKWSKMPLNDLVSGSLNSLNFPFSASFLKYPEAGSQLMLSTRRPLGGWKCRGLLVLEELYKWLPSPLHSCVTERKAKESGRRFKLQLYSWWSCERAQVGGVGNEGIPKTKPSVGPS